MSMSIHIQLLALQYCWGILNGYCVSTFLIALISPSDYLLFTFLKN
jgi:hypothetical protein